MSSVHRLIIGASILLVALLLLGSCGTNKCVPQVEYVRHDSIITRFHTDSVQVIERDSVFVKEKGDTIWLTQWHDVVREHISVRVDTLWQVKEQEVIKTEQVRYVPRYYHWCSWALWIIVAIGLARLAWWLVKKYYMRTTL